MRRMNKGQSALEYAILVACIAGALLAMNIFMKRAVGGKIVSSVDSIGTQFDPAEGKTKAVSIRVKGAGSTVQEYMNKTTSTYSPGDGEQTHTFAEENVTSW